MTIDETQAEGPETYRPPVNYGAAPNPQAANVQSEPACPATVAEKFGVMAGRCAIADNNEAGRLATEWSGATCKSLGLCALVIGTTADSVQALLTQNSDR